jgi:hypothetical protein
MVSAVSHPFLLHHGKDAPKDLGVVLGKHLYGQFGGVPGGAVVFEYHNDSIGHSRKQPCVSKTDHRRRIDHDLLVVLPKDLDHFPEGF